MRMPSVALLLSMAIAGSNLLQAQSKPPNGVTPSRLAIYYGYPSLINGANGDAEKAALTFSGYDVIVLGDGLEFPERKGGRYPEGDAIEHQRARQIIAEVRKRRPETRFFGYVCLGEIPGRQTLDSALTTSELEERIRLWKQLAITGIFLDEAGYDYKAVTRKRQNFAVQTAHDLGLSAFMNAYFLDHLFRLENDLAFATGGDKNPERLAPRLDRRDLFLLESFQVKHGVYEKAEEWQARLKQALEYRRRFGTQIFVTTTTTEQDQFSTEKFNFVWWTASIYGLDGVSWGEPDFSASTNWLPDRRCGLNHTLTTIFQPSSRVVSDGRRFWRKSGAFYYVVDTNTHTVHRVASSAPIPPASIDALLGSSSPSSTVSCEGAME